MSVTPLKSYSFSINDGEIFQPPQENSEDEGLSEAASMALSNLNINESELLSVISLTPLDRIIRGELSCSRHLCWAAIDNMAEKALQGIVLSRKDLGPTKGCLNRMARKMPYGRSILLQTSFGMSKVDASRGLIHTTQLVAMAAVRVFITTALSYRLYQFASTGSFDSSEFSSIFQANSQRGVTSLVHLLAGVDKKWLLLLLTSPFLFGTVKGLWDGCRTRALTNEDIAQLEFAVQQHIRPINGCCQKVSSFVWKNGLKQLLSGSVSTMLQKAERRIRWDGRIGIEEREKLFRSIECLALQGRGLSKMNAMQSLAKIVHSLSIQDFAALKEAGTRNDVLQQVLHFKVLAMQDLTTLASKIESPLAKRSQLNRIYASYLLWWLGMGSLKDTLLFGTYNASKVALQILFLKEICESILEAVRCPDKPGFRMFYGDYAVWANELTPDCFQEFVRQFRFITKDEDIKPFLAQLQNFHLEGVDRFDLANKALTANETQAILQILNQKTTIRYLRLDANLIGDGVADVVFPDKMLELDLGFNDISDTGIAGLRLPPSLQMLNLESNLIGPAGATALKLPGELQSLILDSNQIGDEGAKHLVLPQSLQFLSLEGNQIGVEGIKGLSLSAALQSLSLAINPIGDDGASSLQLPGSLQMLNLGDCQIGEKGIKSLQFPQFLRELYIWNNPFGDLGLKDLLFPPLLLRLDLTGNSIGDEGAKNLLLPSALQDLYLTRNLIGPEGIKGLQLPPKLQLLSLAGNQMGDEGTQNLKLPDTLIALNLGSNSIGVEGIKGLLLPESLRILWLDTNLIGDDGLKNLKLPRLLQSLSLAVNQIGDEGVKSLQLPFLQALNLAYNVIGPAGAQSLQLSSILQVLWLEFNQIGPQGAKSLQLPSSLQTLTLRGSQIGDEGAKNLRLPPSLQVLELGYNNIGPEGAKGLQLPLSLLELHLEVNQMGDDGANWLKLPQFLQTLNVQDNQIGNAGVKVLLEKVAQTNLSSIDLTRNKYNISTLSVQRKLQEQTLLRRCQDKLCHANTPLQDEPLSQKIDLQTSGASRRATLPFNWLKGPFTTLVDRIGVCFSNRLGSHLQEAFIEYTSYLPRIDSVSSMAIAPLLIHQVAQLTLVGMQSLITVPPMLGT